MDAVRVALLREVLAGTEWWGATRRFAGVLRGSVVSHGGGLLLVGTPEYEPWHLAAHLVDEAAWSGTPELAPTLVRHDARPTDPAHLSVGLAARGGPAGRDLAGGVPGPAGRPASGARERRPTGRRDDPLLGPGEGELAAMAHESLAVPEGTDLDLDTVQHLVSAAAGENAVPTPRGRRRFRDRLSRLADQLTAPPPARW